MTAKQPMTRAEIASLGGKRAHQLGKAHQFTSEEARVAGLKGVAVRQANIDARKALEQKNREVSK